MTSSLPIRVALNTTIPVVREGEDGRAAEKVPFPGTVCYAAPYKVLTGHYHTSKQNLICEGKFYLRELVKRSQQLFSFMLSGDVTMFVTNTTLAKV